MLNRIYIVVGIFAIVVLAGAFIVPRFVQWGDYRDRMEVLATSVLGAEVTIRGDISFSLLPRPRLEFTDVVVGDLESPAATVGAVEAEFALMDFLRDIYNVTALSLDSPVVQFTLDENGLFGSGVDLSGSGAGVSLGHARIANGSIRLEDLRSAETFVLDRIDGDLRLSSFIGPFQFQGGVSHGGARYDLRINSAAADAEGNARLSSFVRQVQGGFSATVEGTLTGGPAPRFAGTLVYRQAPPETEVADDIRGDLVLESEITANTDRVVLSGYTLRPDENRAGMRLTGAASIQLGMRRTFDAVVSGGVFSLSPRAATEVPGELPYEFVRLLSEIPAPPLPPMSGRLGIDLAEVGLRGFALRELRLDATTDGTAWTVEQAVARLPGESELRLSGTVSNNAGTVGFVGDVSLVSARLDALSQLWKRPSEDNPLFNMPGSLRGRVMLAGDAFGLSNGILTLDGEDHGVELRLGFGAEPRLDTVFKLGRLNAAETGALLALLPDLTANRNFAVSFPDGSFSLTAGELDILGLPGHELVAEGQWSPDAIRFARLAASDWGGVRIDAGVRLSGTLADPRLTGSGQLEIAEPDAPGLVAIYEMAGVPYGWQEALAGAIPASLQFLLADSDDGVGQVLSVGGDVGIASGDLRVEMTGGLSRLATDDLRLVASLEADSGDLAFRQFGWSGAPLLGEDGSLLASLFVEGSGPDGFDGRVGLSQAGQSVSFFGNLGIAASGAISGQGTIEVAVNDASGLAAMAGTSGTALPGMKASAGLRFDGLRSLTLEGIAGESGGVHFGGDIAMERLGQLPTFSGTLSADRLDAGAIAAALLGREALIGAGDGIWREGPLAAGSQPRPSRGDIAITAQSVTASGAPLLDETRFTFGWSPEAVWLKNWSSEVGGGTLTFAVEECCSGAFADRRLAGQATLNDVDLAALAPDALAEGLSGRLTAGVQFEGTGASLADVVRGLSGEGNFTLTSLVARGLSPGVFPAVSSFEDVLNTEADALETLVGLALGQGDFAATEAQGAFTIAGGTVRLANVIVAGEGARLAGSVNLALPRLGLDGGFVMTPRDFVDASGLVQADLARILVRLGGTLFAPDVTVDLSEMVAAIQMRASEIEVERLNQLRLEDEARQRAAAEERNRLIEEQRRRAAEERARILAEEEAARLEEQRRLEQEMDRIPDDLPPPTPAPVPQLNLGYQPGVNQPIGDPVNQPIQLFPGQ